MGSLTGRNIAVIYHITAEHEAAWVFPIFQDWKAMYFDDKVDEMSRWRQRRGIEIMGCTPAGSEQEVNQSYVPSQSW